MPPVSLRSLKAQLKRKNARWQADRTPQTDLTDYEKSAMLGVIVDHAALATAMAPMAVLANFSFDPAVDWRNRNGNHIAPIENQGQCGSCVSFCCAALVASMSSIEQGMLLNLSEADLHFNSNHGASCGGWWPNDALEWVRVHGVVRDRTLAYSAAFDSPPQSDPNPPYLWIPHQHLVPSHDQRAVRINSWRTISDVSERKHYLTTVGPCSAVIDIYDDFYSYRSGVYHHISGILRGSHCVEIIGYSEAEQCWLIKNSWGTSWGDNGFGKIAYGEIGIDSTYPFWGAQGVLLPPPLNIRYKEPLGAVSRHSDQLDLFVTGTNGCVYTSWWTAGYDWSGVNNNWRNVGGFFPPGNPVSSVSRHPEQLDLFVVGNDGCVYTSWWTAGYDWSGVNNNWRNIGGFFPLDSQVSAVSRHPEQLDLFVVGNDGRVYTSWWTAGYDWSGVNNNWRSIGGFFPIGAPISAVSRQPEQLDLFVVGNDGRVYTSWWHAGSDWSGINDNWRPIGGFFPPGTAVTAVARTPYQLDLFVVGNDGRVYTSWWHAGSDWSGINNNWRPIGGFFPVGARVSAVARMPYQLDLFVVGNDGRVYTSWWHAGYDWSGINDNWRPIGGFFPPGTPVATLARMPYQLDLFVVGNDGRVYTSWWHAGSDWSGINDNWRPIGGFFPTPGQ